jgi:hypothetical protein
LLGDGLDVEFTNPNTGEIFKYSDSVEKGLREYDNMYDSSDESTAREIQKWMREMVELFKLGSVEANQQYN